VLKVKTQKEIDEIDFIENIRVERYLEIENYLNR